MEGIGELHSFALDFQNFTEFMDVSDNSALFSPMESDFSSGYLEDVLVEFGERFKRKRFLFDQNRASTDNAAATTTQGFDNSADGMNFVTASMENNSSEETEIKNKSGLETLESSSSSYNLQTQCVFITANHSGGKEKRSKKKTTKRRLVYPFTMVKPGGVDGDITINDINKRILMPPTRPVKHPVGDYACRPLVSSTGPGLSGKAIVALTRIHTQGSGTITIVRTKG